MFPILSVVMVCANINMPECINLETFSYAKSTLIMPYKWKCKGLEQPKTK